MMDMTLMRHLHKLQSIRHCEQPRVIPLITDFSANESEPESEPESGSGSAYELSSAEQDDRARISLNLLSADRSPSTILFMVFKTIDSNPGITVNQLRWLLKSEFMLPDTTTDTAIGALTSRSLLDSVARWQMTRHKDIIKLRAKEPKGFKMTEWLARTLAAYPEMESFKPPIFRKRKT